MKKLSSYRWLILDINSSSRTIKETEQLDLPCERATSLIARMRKAADKSAAEAKEIADYIEAITEPTVKQIAIMYIYNGKSWEDIGDSLYMDRTTVARKLKNYCAKDGVEI